jgi:gluconolactonase
MANTETGVVQSFGVGAGGSLTPRAPLASGVSIPDGLCVDVAGNVYVATWGADTIEVFSPAGDHLGALSFPSDVTNCAFGGTDLRTLYVTTIDGVWAVPMALPGVADWN